MMGGLISNRDIAISSDFQALKSTLASAKHWRYGAEKNKVVKATDPLKFNMGISREELLWRGYTLHNPSPDALCTLLTNAKIGFNSH